jgi:hypothetical protein
MGGLAGMYWQLLQQLCIARSLVNSVQAFTRDARKMLLPCMLSALVYKCPYFHYILDEKFSRCSSTTEETILSTTEVADSIGLF